MAYLDLPTYLTIFRWNRVLLRALGLAMGEEFRGKGVNITLWSMMNSGRVAQGGRN